MSDAILESVKAKLPTYLAWAADVNSHFDAVEWWFGNQDHLPQWSLAARKIFLVNNSFGSRQQNSLEDYVEASVMLQLTYQCMVTLCFLMFVNSWYSMCSLGAA